MWKARPEDAKPTNVTPNPAQPVQSATISPAPTTATTPQMTSPKETQKTAMSAERSDVGHIGKSVVIKGELTGNEDLYLDGEIEGNVDLRDHRLVIGPNGKIKATISARDVVLHGRVEGNVTAAERVELKKSCTLVGDVATQRIVIEDGAFFKGSIDIKENRETKAEPRKSIAAAAGASTGSSSFSSGATYSAGSGSQGSFLEPK